MDKQKIDKVIDAFRSAMYQEFSVSEEGMVANPPGGSGGFGGQSNPAGPTAGYDPTFKLDGRNKFVRKAIDDLMSRKKKRQDKVAMRKAMKYNPYFGNGKAK